jgi:predicted outer membrane lipoprotein
MNATPFALLAYIFGVVLAVLYGIISARKAGEPWDWNKFGVSMIVSVVGALGEGYGTAAGDEIIGTGSFIWIIGQALFAGFGTIYVVSKSMKQLAH